MRKLSLPLILATLLGAATISGCSPKFDWRDYRSNEAPYAVQFPAKPASQTRSVNLDGVEVNMSMTAAEVDGVTFAVGSAEMADPAKAVLALQAMKTALVRNIAATVTRDKIAVESSGSGQQDGQRTTLEVEARGAQKAEPMLLVGRFIAKGNRIYQVIVVGKEKNLVRETVDTFMSSFKLN